MKRRRLPLLLGLLLAAACSKPAPPDEATLRAEDKRTLEGIVAFDVRVSQAMRDADEATGKGDAGAAAGLVMTKAKPAADQGLATAESATLKTDWGREKRTELVGILRDREAEMPRYEAAVKDGDPEKMLTAIEAQAAIERRALSTVAALRANQ